ncbi:hypothetical protein CASFOL_007320 [Castilleja foliolosa]|uniref:NPH3 domain-containing protein n=1 Tax=Castilleja foliolosa TaxID=1961234 RepID=A0ABD3EAY8_9LAMI
MLSDPDMFHIPIDTPGRNCTRSQPQSSYLSFAPPELLFGKHQTDEQGWVDTIKSVGNGATARISTMDWLGQSQFLSETVHWSSLSETLNPYNVVAARCAAEYLSMTEDLERGNLIQKIEIFLNSSVLHNWKDSIIVLQTTKSLVPASENLKIIGRCVDSIASKTSVDPSIFTWSYTYNRKLATSDQIIQSNIKFPEKNGPVPKDWWVEDICELDFDLYKTVMVAIKSKSRMDGGIIGEALKSYAVRWLPDSVDALLSEVTINRNKTLVETIICLLPSDKGIMSCACSFLLKLLKVAILIGVDESPHVGDLLVPARLPWDTIYDVELVQRLVDTFVANEKSKSDSEFVLGHGPWLRVGKVVDGYLTAIAHDLNLSVTSFVKLARSIPELARPIHDGLYGAIDIYLKKHDSLTKSERKSLCGLIEVKKLTTDASMHAAQNEQLPLRVVVQVLFCEQSKASANNARVLNNSHEATDTPRSSGRENWTKTGLDNRRSLRKQMDEMKVKEDHEGSIKNRKLTKRGSKNRGSGAQLLPSRSRRIFDKLWIVGKGLGNGENKSSETSASSQSPGSLIQGEMKPSGLLLRNRRHSIS